MGFGRPATPIGGGRGYYINEILFFALHMQRSHLMARSQSCSRSLCVSFQESSGANIDIAKSGTTCSISGTPEQVSSPVGSRVCSRCSNVSPIKPAAAVPLPLRIASLWSEWSCRTRCIISQVAKAQKQITEIIGAGPGRVLAHLVTSSYTLRRTALL